MAKYALEKKALDVLILDLRKLTTITDFFVICHGESTQQVRAICEHVQDQMEELGVRVWHREGFENLSWVLLDYVDIVVHIFMPETREFYGLERLWGDASIEKIRDEE
ncbi:ribosome silencing factor [candidate division KSB1 bacterium]|nr:ribosome silencing factor [candidate division KSB1 bacterium]